MNIPGNFRSPIFLLVLLAFACISNAQTSAGFKLVSPAFSEGKAIPAKFACDGENVSPSLHWSGVPASTKSFAIIMDDPDAPMGNWVHWVMYNIPDTLAGLGERKTAAELKAVDGLNSWDEKGYNGPCPPGGTHRYIFKLYALDVMLPQKEGMTREGLLEAMKGHILAETSLTGLFRE